MLVIPGYIEKGQFVPDSPALISGSGKGNFDGRGTCGRHHGRKSPGLGEFIEAIRNIKDKELPGMPERAQFRTPEKIERPLHCGGFSPSVCARKQALLSSHPRPKAL
jgi:hypothetical protein